MVSVASFPQRHVSRDRHVAASVICAFLGLSDCIVWPATFLCWWPWPRWVLGAHGLVLVEDLCLMLWVRAQEQNCGLCVDSVSHVPGPRPSRLHVTAQGTSWALGPEVCKLSCHFCLGGGLCSRINVEL